MRKQAKRSPLRVRPLRSPGQALQDQIDDLLYDRLTPLALGMFVALVMAAIEWWRYYVPSPPAPGFITFFAVLWCCYALYRLVPGFRELRNLQLGLQGEKVVGQCLEDQRAQGCRVFHDVPGDGFNLDHVVVAPSGIYAVETKTLSKPVGQDAQVTVDGETLRVDGVVPSRNYLAQVAAQRSWLRDLLHESTGRQFPVKGVLVFPGWFVKGQPPKKTGLWVLNPKALAAFLQHEPSALAPEDVALVSQRLAEYVRSHS